MSSLHSLWIVAAASFVTYTGVSFLLFRYPHILHKKKRIAFRCVHISHRGGAGENLENTMTAFQHAVKCGTHMLEIDCQLTRDGHVVVAHDNSLRRIAGIDGNISDFDFRDLPPVRSELQLDFNRDFIYRTTGTDRRIPLLRELFEQFPELPINIDIKRQDDRLIKEVSDLVKEFKREHLIVSEIAALTGGCLFNHLSDPDEIAFQTVWGNFIDSLCLQCYKHNPNIHLLFSLRRVFYLIIFYYTGLLPFVSFKEDFLEILMPSVFLSNPHIMYEPTQRQRLLLQIIDKLIMSRSLFMHLRKRGIHVYLWVLNSEEEYKRAFELGANGVMTDFPSMLSAFLASHPQYDRDNCVD